MEILKRATKPTDGEVVPWNENPQNVREEAIRRSAKAGYCASGGEPPFATKIMSRVSWGRSKLNVWPRDSQGRLIE